MILTVTDKYDKVLALGCVMHSMYVSINYLFIRFVVMTTAEHRLVIYTIVLCVHFPLNEALGVFL